MVLGQILEKKNLQSVLRAIGAFEENTVEEVAIKIYEQGRYDDCQYTVVLVCIGRHANQELAKKYHSVLQITWRQVSQFIYCRFKSFNEAKVSHGQWDDVGKELWKCVEDSKSESEFQNHLSSRINPNLFNCCT